MPAALTMLALILGGLLASALLLPLVANADDSQTTVQDINLYVDETVEVQTGKVDRLLNLDPELVKATVKEPDGFTVKGRRYGTATVRVWGEVGMLILRIQILGRRPAARQALGPKALDTRAFVLSNSLRYFGYETSGRADEWTDVAVHELEANLRRGNLTGTMRTWLEERDADWDLPHYDLLLEQRRTGALSRLVLHLGTVESNWSQRTFSRKRLEGGRLEFHFEGSGRRASHRSPVPLSSRSPTSSQISGSYRTAATRSSRLGLEVMYGRDVTDFVSLGSRTRVDTRTDARLGGGRLWWTPSPLLDTQLEVGLRQEPGDGTQSVTALITKSNITAFGLESLLSYDGSLWAGRALARWSAASTGLSVNGQYLEDGFRDLRVTRGHAGARSVGLNAHHSLRKDLRLSGSSAWRRWQRTEVDTLGSSLFRIAELITNEERQWRDSWDHSVRASYRAGSHLLINGWWKLSETEISDPHWRRHKGGSEISAHNLTASEALDFKFGLTLGWEYATEKAGEPIDGTYRWNSLRIDPNLSLSDWLSLTGRIEGRFAREDNPTDPGDFQWEARATGRLPAAGPLASGRLSIGYREWEHLNTTDGTFSTGRHISARIQTRTHPWNGFSLEVLGNWNRNPDEDTDNVTVQVGLVSRVGFGEAPTPGAITYKGTIKGRVFHDENSNGQIDDGETGLAGVTLRLEDGSVALTDEDGKYRFKGVKGVHALVRIMPERADVELVPTTPVVREVPIAEADWVDADFGLGPAPAWLEVVVFNDLDENGEMEEGEPFVPDVLVNLRELDVQLRSSQREAARHMLPLGQQVTCEWLPASLPDGYSPVGRIGQLAVLPQAGETVRWEIPLKALRSVSGVVFLDENGNGRRDPGEAPVEGVTLQAGNRFAVTDAQGRYTLKALPAGTVEISIRQGTIPENCRAPEPLNLHLNTEPVTIRDSDVGLGPR
jgi:hypothetical protein